MCNVVRQTQFRERRSLRTSCLSAEILRNDDPFFIRNARYPFLIPYTLFLELQNMLYLGSIITIDGDEISKAVDMGLSDTFVEEESGVRHAEAVSR